MKQYAADPTMFYMIDRCISALLGTATVLIVYRLAEKLFDRKTAIISSLFLSFAYLHVRTSHFGVTDVPMTFFVMLSVLFCIKARFEKTPGNYALAGLFAGLAASTKYNAVLVVFSMFVVHLFNVLDETTIADG